MAAEVVRLPGRRHPRVPLGSNIAVQIPDWEALRARALDVSYGGMSLILPRRVAVGDKLVFGLNLPDGRPVEMAAVVRNVVPTGRDRFRVGLEWAGLVDEVASELRVFVDRAANEAA